MSRLTKREGGKIYYREAEGKDWNLIGRMMAGFSAVEKLAHYEDLEDQLEKLFGSWLSLDTVVDNMNCIIQNGEEKLEFARILANAEAEKWDKWRTLEEQGRLIEQKYAQWEYVRNGVGICSNCHRMDGIDNLATHCRYCGAKMITKGETHDSN